MRRLKLTYYLLTLVCITFTSCISEDIISTYPSDKESGKTQIHLTMKLSETGNVNETSSPYDFSYERYINDVSIYIFSKDDKFIEQINNPQITGNDGDATRTIFGILEEDYSTYTNGIEIIVLTNLAKRGVTAPQLVTNQTKEDLYNMKESEVIEIIENSKYKDIFNIWKNAKNIKVSKEKPETVYFVHHGAKIRYIDPLVNKRRISSISEEAKKEIDKNLSYDMNNYVYLDFNF